MHTPNSQSTIDDTLVQRLQAYFDIHDGEHDACGKRERQQIVVQPHFQLIFSAQKEPVGAEVLVRFRDGSTDQQIPLQAALQLISKSPSRMHQLSSEIIAAAAAALPTLMNETRNKIFCVWINTPGSGVSYELIAKLLAAARKHDIPPSQIGLEILEGDRAVDKAVFNESVPHGIPFALDDLGSNEVDGGIDEARKSGILSLHGHEVGFQKVKVDRTLRANRALYLTAICRLLHLFRGVTVEGIEDQQQLSELLRLAQVSTNIDRAEILRLEDDELLLQLESHLNAPLVAPAQSIPDHLSIQGYIHDNKPRPLEDVVTRLRQLQEAQFRLAGDGSTA